MLGLVKMNKEALLSALSRFTTEVQRLLEETWESGDKAIFKKYLHKANAILCKVERGDPFDEDVSAMDLLFGRTWLTDTESYRNAYSEWDTFKGLLVQSIHGMTVNERLLVLGLLDEFDTAATSGDVHHLRRILEKCFVDEQTIEAIIKNEVRKNG